jgi:hypothetical protein
MENFIQNFYNVVTGVSFIQSWCDMAKEKTTLSSSVKGSKTIRERRIPIKAEPVLRQDIGASNPYAIAEVLYEREYNESLKWKDDSAYNRDLMQGILACDYDKLFDPIHGASVLFKRAVYDTIGIKPKIALMKRKSLPLEFPKLGGGIIKLTPKRPIPLPQIRKPSEKPCSEAGHHWGTYKKSDGTQANYCLKAQGYKSEIIDDAAQGCTKSCYFIAALASNAWCKYPNFPANMTNDGLLQPSYTIQFYFPSEEITVGRCLVLNSANSPVFARPSSANEVWAAIYEKAYSKYLSESEYILNPDADCSSPYPDIPALSGGNPVTALSQLTGGTINNFENSAYKDNPGGSFAQIKTAITWKDANQTQGVTSYPMAAWTYISSAAAKLVHGKDITYKNEIIVANHSYSILGVVVANSKNYIVLRNPYGRLLGIPDVPPDPTDAGFTPYLYTGGWSPVATGFSRTLSLKDGIFALQADKFEDYFEGFGWVS